METGLKSEDIKTVPCCIVHYNCTQPYTPIRAVLIGELGPFDLGLVFLCFFVTKASLFVIGLVILCFVCVVFGCCFIASTSTTDCLERPVSEVTYY